MKMRLKEYYEMTMHYFQLCHTRKDIRGDIEGLLFSHNGSELGSNLTVVLSTLSHLGELYRQIQQHGPIALRG